jgi:hypothetical protein
MCGKLNNIRISYLLSLLLIVNSLSLSKTNKAAQAVIYVDPVNGKDSNDGLSLSSALKTIIKARDKVRLINATMSGDILVYLRGGTYIIDSTISFETKDSGENGFNVIYKAYNDEKPVICGGKKVTGWSLYDASKNIYKAVIDTGISFRQIYVNGRRAVRARIPNLTDIITFAGYYTAISSNPFVVNTSEVSNWSKLNEVECVWVAHWHEKRAHISSFETNGDKTTIDFTSPENASPVLNQATNEETNHKTSYYFENAYEFLDEEGEWYLDNDAHILYYKPRSSEDIYNSEVITPVVENLVTLTGNIHNIQFYGITFEYSNWTEPDKYGYLDWQAGLQLETNGGSAIPGMIQIDYANNLRFEKNIFVHSGAHGLVTVHNTSNVTVIGNKFTDMAGGGIYFNSAIGNGASSHDVISNNLVEKIGRVYSDCVGIVATNVANMTIEHNLIQYCPYTGISIGWSWDDTDKGSLNNDVSYNRINYIMQLHDDGGGIYTLGRMPNSNFHNNYISHIVRSSYQGGNPFAGIYLDNGSCYKTVENNVLDSTFSAFYAINAPNHDNTIHNNYYNVIYGDVSNDNVTSNNEFCRVSNWPAAALSIMSNAGIEAEYSDPTSVNEGQVDLPKRFLLSQNFPNPFNPVTIIKYSLPETSNVRLEVFNALGQRVAIPVNELQGAGIYNINFNGRNLSSGVYFYKLTAGSHSDNKKMLLLK